MSGKNNAAGRKSGRSVFIEYTKAVLWAVVLAFVIRVEFVEANRIPSGSMEPTLLIGDHIIVSKIAYGLKAPFSHRVLIPTGEPKRGDVIVFDFPESKDPFIKRIIGLPGDIVETVGTTIFINGQKLDEPWGRYEDVRPPHPYYHRYGPVKVPTGSYFVMGDNRDHSYDSRFWNGGRGGFVPGEDILGKALVVHWSWKDGGWGVRWSRPGTVLR